jgi:hypothetical protein
MSIGRARYFKFGKDKLSNKPKQRRQQIYEAGAAREYAIAVKRDKLGSHGAASECRKIEVTDDEKARLQAIMQQLKPRT